jgi:uncharacterized protein YndB with AHSA1/START domain
MTVVNVTKDPERLTLYVVAEFAASSERVWRVFEDPRQLERWWGPPMFPATFTAHDFTVGGESRYHMTGPNGETPRGWWRIIAMDRPRRLEFLNGLAGDDGEPRPDVEPMPSRIDLEPVEGGTRMTVVANFVSPEQMAMYLDMGMAEGLAGAMGQIDSVLAVTN